MRAYIEQILAVYPSGSAQPIRATFEDMSLQLETPEAAVLLVFTNIDIYADPSRDTLNYGLNLNMLYLKEKP
jgi:hypothetical protein